MKNFEETKERAKLKTLHTIRERRSSHIKVSKQVLDEMQLSMVESTYDPMMVEMVTSLYLQTLRKEGKITAYAKTYEPASVWDYIKYRLGWSYKEKLSKPAPVTIQVNYRAIFPELSGLKQRVDFCIEKN